MREPHTWKFFRAGGFDQVQLDSGADLLALDQLDQKLWVALSCPTRGIEFDQRTLDLIDTDGDGQVRAREVLAAIAWAGALLKDPDLLARNNSRLALSDIADDTAEGRDIAASARHILQSLGKSQAGEISLEDMADIERFLASLQFNGDGVVCAKQVEDGDLRSAVEDIARTQGTLPDMSGDQGIDQKIADTFFTEAREYAEWYAKGEADAAILPLGQDSLGAADALHAVQEKVDDYFTRCQMAAFDVRAALPLSRAVEDYQRLATQVLSKQNADIAGFPLASIEADRPLPLRSGINPVWLDRMEALQLRVVRPLLGERDDITAGEWAELCARFAAHAEWQKAKPVTKVDELGIERLRELINGDCQARIGALIAQDKAVEPEIRAIRSVERLIRYQRDLFRLANNFVSFRDFYSGREQAIFQLGTLYLDGRSCNLCVKVDDVATHAGYANASGICLAYCELVRGSEKMYIAAAFTAGDADFLTAGRHGVFYDREERDWLATIVRIVDHPISIRQAFWSPYKKLSRAISEQMQKFASSKASAVQEKMTQTVLEGGKGGAPAKAPFDVAKFAGIFAAIGLAIGAIGGILASIVGGILSLKVWQVPLAVMGLMLAVSGPSMALAWFKLKRRNLGPILDACGWAINARALINIPFGTSLTGLPHLPPGAHRSLSDPYAQKQPLWPYVIALMALGLLGWAWYAGYLSK